MKKLFFVCALAVSCTFAQTASAQSVLKNLLKSAASNAASSTTSSSTTSSSSSSSTSGSSVLGTLLNGVVSNATSGDNTTSSLIGNLISSVTGSVTTTQANLVGSWSYTAPAVQFESENLLTKAGGTAVATKVEAKLATYYKIVGIKAGTFKFSFAEDGTCTYGLGSKSLSGTYTFDSSAKTVTIKTTTGQSVKAYVTISGSTMSLCFDGSKLLTLFTNLSSKVSSLKTVSTLASSYSGMKVGFKFAKQ